MKNNIAKALLACLAGALLYLRITGSKQLLHNLAAAIVVCLSIVAVIFTIRCVYAAHSLMKISPTTVVVRPLPPWLFHIAALCSVLCLAVIGTAMIFNSFPLDMLPGLFLAYAICTALAIVSAYEFRATDEKVFFNSYFGGFRSIPRSEIGGAFFKLGNLAGASQFYPMRRLEIVSSNQRYRPIVVNIGAFKTNDLKNIRNELQGFISEESE